MKLIDLNIKIEYNPETDEIVSYSTSLNGVAEKTKTTTTRKSLSKKKDDGTESFLVREENKLSLSQKLVEMLGAEPDDRIAINYEKDDINKITFPVIGLSYAFGGKESGNKLTKSNTVAYRGNSNSTLAEFGTRFTIEPYGNLKPNIFKLIGDNQSEKALVPEVAIKQVNMGIEVTGDENYEIEDLDFKL
jgi:hypothetical protein